MKYYVKTLGCAMNISDSERLASFLEKMNFSPSEKMEKADLVIFNTCGIRQAAENRVYSLINNIRKTSIKEQNKLTIVVTGCLAHRADVQKRLRGKVDLFTETKDFPEKFKIMNQETKIKQKKEIARDSLFMILDSTKSNKEQIDYLSIRPSHSSSFQALVPIMTGCDNFCSYCVVPYARGREKSRSANEIIDEIKSLVAKKYKHITLLGQNVNSYHDGKTDFPMLLKKINAIPGKFWITFVSSHPKDMDDKLIETVAKCKKVCEWIHLPVQAGDDKILRRMNRKYTQKHYLECINKIKKAFKEYKPDSLFSISSDIIVGFPGETKKQFMQSAVVMQKARFDMVFFGQFSPRPGTVAWKMKDNVSNKEKERRETLLNDILKKTSLANNKKYIGEKMEVLIEKEKDGHYFGKTRTQKKVKIVSSKKITVGEFKKIRITKAASWNLEGIV